MICSTATNKNGYYELIIEEADTVVLNFSMIGYTSVQQRIIDLHDVINVNVQLLTDEQLLTEIEVRGIKHTQGHKDIKYPPFEIRPKTAKFCPPVLPRQTDRWRQNHRRTMRVKKYSGWLIDWPNANLSSPRP